MGQKRVGTNTPWIKLDEINLGVDRLANGEVIRQVIVF
jgi:Zn-dependent alcohol dehydrogenase